MDTDQNSTQALSPKAIATLFDSLADSLRQPLGIEEIDKLSSAGGYDWAAGIAVREAIEDWVHPSLVIRVLGDMVRSQAEADEVTPGIPMALDMLDKAELLGTGRLDPDNDHVRWRLLGMIADSEGSRYQHDAALLLDAALTVATSDVTFDNLAAKTLLEKAARQLVREVFIGASLRCGEYGRAVPAVHSEAAAEEVLSLLVASLAALPRHADAANENGVVSHAS